MNPVPVTVMVPPPPATPCKGETPVTVGTGSQVKMSAGDAEDGPPAVVTVMSWLPGTLPGAAGAVAVIDVLELMVKRHRGWLPKSTAVAVLKPGTRDGDRGPRSSGARPSG